MHRQVPSQVVRCSGVGAIITLVCSNAEPRAISGSGKLNYQLRYYSTRIEVPGSVVESPRLPLSGNCIQCTATYYILAWHGSRSCHQKRVATPISY